MSRWTVPLRPRPRLPANSGCGSTRRHFRPHEALDDPDDFRDAGVAVARVMVPHPRHWLYELLFERLVPELGARLHGLPDLRAMTYIRTYDLILPISEFSQHWLQRYWGLPGQILYPPVYVDDVVERPKRPLILGVGRFFDRSHNKRHDVLIRAFQKLSRQVPEDWGAPFGRLHRTGTPTRSLLRAAATHGAGAGRCIFT